MIVKYQKPFTHEQSDSFMCVPACLNMIFQRHEMKTFPQVEIAYKLGLKVPSELKSKYPNASISDDELDWGVHPGKEGVSIEEFLSDNNINLICRYVSAKGIPSSSLVDFLSDNIENNNDILVGYNYATAFKSGLNTGHVSLIQSIDTLQNFIELIDPEDVLPVKIRLSDLLSGIFDKNSGFWVFGEIQKLIHFEYV